MADHRNHHPDDDEEEVHSHNRGFPWAYMLWRITPDSAFRHTPEYLRWWAADLDRDPVHRFLVRFHVAFALLMFAALHALGGFPWLVWSGFVRSILVLHSTWVVNSANHWGYRTYPTRDTSTNLWWVALLTFGVGWHNNHHAVPTPARHGLRRWELDPTFWTIRLMSWVGLVKDVKLPRFTPFTPSASAERTRRSASRTMSGSRTVSMMLSM